LDRRQPEFAEAEMSSIKRQSSDIMKLMMSDFEVQVGDSPSEFFVKFHGPKDSYYEGGIWKLRVGLPANYPYKSPSIGFCNTIFHPNVDEASGSVCLDVINQAWSPMFELVNVFAVFLPQLLLYPNPSDPLNGAAAALMMKDKKAYETKVREYVKRCAMVDFSLASDDDEEEEEEDEKSSSHSASSSSPSPSPSKSSSTNQSNGVNGIHSSTVTPDVDLDLEMGDEEAFSDLDEEVEDDDTVCY